MVTENSLYEWNEKPHTVTLTYPDGSTITHEGWTCSNIRHKPKRHPVTKQRYTNINIFPEPARSASWIAEEYGLAVYHKHPILGEKWAVSYNNLGDAHGS